MPLKNGGCQKQGPGGQETLGFHQEYQSTYVPRGENVNSRDGRQQIDLRNNSVGRNESLLPEYKSWESGPKVQKNNNPGVEGLRFEKKNNREASATSARYGGRYG